MVDVSKYPFMTRRKGSKNWWYKRSVPKALIADGRPKQIWRSLGNPEAVNAKIAYRRIDSEIDQLFCSWGISAGETVPSVGGAPGVAQTTNSVLSAALLRKLCDDYHASVYDQDFRFSGELWLQAKADQDAFYRGEIAGLPGDALIAIVGNPSTFAEDFLSCRRSARWGRIFDLEQRYQLGEFDIASTEAASVILETHQLSLHPKDLQRLQRQLMSIEVNALREIATGKAETVRGDQHPPLTSAPPPAKALLELAEVYVEEATRLQEWPLKTVKRKRTELREFIELAGNKPVNAYTHKDGEKFKAAQLRLPANRQQHPYRNLTLTAAADAADRAKAKGNMVQLLSPLTINDKLGTVSLFFDWARLRDRDAGILNPVAELAIPRPKGRSNKKPQPWSVAELNRMMAAPIYTGCRSLSRWAQPGAIIPNRAAIYWVPLIALYSGLRLGEIVQLRVTDIKQLDDIKYFDVRTIIDDEEFDGVDLTDAEIKSIKNSNGRRGIPVHTALHQIGFVEFLAFRRASKSERLFPEYDRALDDNSWSKQFSKHFTRFRRSIGVTRRGVTFQSLRHNVEDKLRNADVRKEVRDAVQGHGETGVSREYGSGYYLRTLNEAIQKITYEGLRLPKGP